MACNQLTTESIERDSNGRWLRPPVGAGKITSANARELQLKSAASRRNKAMQAARVRVQAEIAAVDSTVDSPEAAWGAMAARTASALMDSDKPRADQLIDLGRIMGTMPLDYETRIDDKAAAQGAAQATLAGLGVLLSMLRGDVVDGEVIPMRTDIEGDTE